MCVLGEALVLRQVTCWSFVNDVSPQCVDQCVHGIGYVTLPMPCTKVKCGSWMMIQYPIMTFSMLCPSVVHVSELLV